MEQNDKQTEKKNQRKLVILSLKIDHAEKLLEFLEAWQNDADSSEQEIVVKKIIKRIRGMLTKDETIEVPQKVMDAIGQAAQDAIDEVKEAYQLEEKR